VRLNVRVVQREQVYQSTFDEALIGIAQTCLDGRFLLVNRYLCRLLGYSADELSATDFMSISHPGELALDLEGRTQLISGAVDRYSREKRYRRKNGTFVWTNLTVSLHRDSAGTPSYFISIIEDITERRRAVVERELLEQQVRQIHKMEAIGRLAGGVAHDFNNLLTVIVGYADLMLAEPDTEGQLRHDLLEIRKAGDSATALTRQLLAFSRQQILQPQILDLNAIVTRAGTLLRRLIAEDIRLETRLGDGLDRVCADPGQIEQVILNLALNARDAMPGGGTLSIETANVELDAHDHPGAAAGPHVLLAVRDTGIGMDRAVQERLFEPFYSTKEPGKGTGLGLATVYGIVKQSGGSIAVESAPDRGAVFRVFLPRDERSADVAIHESPAATAPRRGAETILLVEDQDDVRTLTSETLARHGYVVIQAASGDDALQAAGRHRGRIDLLLTDVVMPGLSGNDLAAQFVRDYPAGRVLYMSGYADAAVVQRDIAARNVAFIQKPFTPAVLLEKLRDVLDDGDAS
jgi:two-component system cell cycle sensor histidine kinase/response regulator CckA